MPLSVQGIKSRLYKLGFSDDDIKYKRSPAWIGLAHFNRWCMRLQQRQESLEEKNQNALELLFFKCNTMAVELDDFNEMERAIAEVTIARESIELDVSRLRQKLVVKNIKSTQKRAKKLLEMLNDIE